MESIIIMYYVYDNYCNTKPVTRFFTTSKQECIEKTLRIKLVKYNISMNFLSQKLMAIIPSKSQSEPHEKKRYIIEFIANNTKKCDNNSMTKQEAKKLLIQINNQLNPIVPGAIVPMNIYDRIYIQTPDRERIDVFINFTTNTYCMKGPYIMNFNDINDHHNGIDILYQKTKQKIMINFKLYSLFETFVSKLIDRCGYIPNGGERSHINLLLPKICKKYNCPDEIRTIIGNFINQNIYYFMNATCMC